jgi:hypothetical protein
MFPVFPFCRALQENLHRATPSTSPTQTMAEIMLEDLSNLMVLWAA